jgi:hypothetical protein
MTMLELSYLLPFAVFVVAVPAHIWFVRFIQRQNARPVQPRRPFWD